MAETIQPNDLFNHMKERVTITRVSANFRKEPGVITGKLTRALREIKLNEQGLARDCVTVTIDTGFAAVDVALTNLDTITKEA